MSLDGTITTRQLLKFCWTTGADANARNIFGVTPLFPTVQFQETPVMIWVLLEAGADVNAGTDGGAHSPAFGSNAQRKYSSHQSLAGSRR